jgi:molybdopterin-guanine dinucleotide biosynthesis protein A
MADGPVIGLVLAGGQSTRMGGGDKCLRPLGGRPILAHILDRLRPQVDHLVLNANGDAARFAAFGAPVAADTVAGFAGPLAGILAGLRWTAARFPSATAMVSVASDAPFLPADLVAALRAGAAAAGVPLACAASDGRTHPVFGLWRLDLAEDLERALRDEDLRKVDRWTARHGCAQVDFPVGDVDPFFNVNRPEDLARAEETLARAARRGV